MEEKHSEMVRELAKPGQEILPTLTTLRVASLHMAMGISGEAGEVVDEIKKTVMYDRDFNPGKIIEELGDLEFYLEGLRQALGISREDVLAGNIQKLRKRYGKSYSDQAANARVDKS